MIIRVCDPFLTDMVQGVCVRVIASQLRPPTARISTATITIDTHVGTEPRERLDVLER